MDNLLSVIEKLYLKMAGYVKGELEKKGYGDLYLSHGSILINFYDKDALNYKELGNRINKSPQTMTTLVRKLEEGNYITLRKDPNDLRNKLVSLTEKGKEFIPVMLEISKKMYEIQYTDMSEEDEKIVKDLIKRILENFKKVS